MADLKQVIGTAAVRWMEAWVERDSAVLEESLAAEFTLVVSATPALQVDRADRVYPVRRFAVQLPQCASA